MPKILCWHSARQTSAAAITAGGVAGWRSLIGAMEGPGVLSTKNYWRDGAKCGFVALLSSVAEHLHRLVSGRSASDQP